MLHSAETASWIRLRHHGDSVVVEVAGPIDADVAEELRAKVATALEAAPAAVIDLSRVTALDPAGLTALHKLQANALGRGRTVVLAGAHRGELPPATVAALEQGALTAPDTRAALWLVAEHAGQHS